MDRQQLVFDCRRTAEDILEFVSARAHVPGAGRRYVSAEAVIAHSTAFQDEFTVEFGDRLQHLIIHLSEAGFTVDRLDALSYAGTDRLGARAAAETLQEISEELMRAAEQA